MTEFPWHVVVGAAVGAFLGAFLAVRMRGK